MTEPQAGQPARKEGKWEIIGPQDCPIVARRTLLDVGFGKILWHRFFPGASDKDPHDHPRSFVTIILRGGYADISRGPLGIFVGEDIRAPTIRFRRATHAHITRVHDDGATTLVIMGPLRRDWGFWKDGAWFEWKTYERIFGLNWRCDD